MKILLVLACCTAVALAKWPGRGRQSGFMGESQAGLRVGQTSEQRSRMLGMVLGQGKPEGRRLDRVLGQGKPDGGRLEARFGDRRRKPVSHYSFI